MWKVGGINIKRAQAHAQQFFYRMNNKVDKVDTLNPIFWGGRVPTESLRKQTLKMRNYSINTGFMLGFSEFNDGIEE